MPGAAAIRAAQEAARADFGHGRFRFAPLGVARGFLTLRARFRKRLLVSCTSRASKNALRASFCALRASLRALRARQITSQLRSEAPDADRNRASREAWSCKHVSQHLARKEICFACKAKCAESRLRSFANGAKRLALALVGPGHESFRFCAQHLPQLMAMIVEHSAASPHKKSREGGFRLLGDSASLCSGFAPFEKGGYGGFALALASRSNSQKQKQIPLNPPFSKGDARAHSLDHWSEPADIIFRTTVRIMAREHANSATLLLWLCPL